MAEIETPSTTADDIEKTPTNESESARKWIAEIAAAEKAQAKWVERAKKVERIYNDERDLSTGRARKFNILWSNVETLRPAVYMNTPKAKASRRYRDKDPVARLASMLLERCLETSCELYDFDNAMDQLVRDRLVVGRGQAWCFYVPEFAGQGDNALLAYESVMVEYVPWPDFLHSVCRTWAENRWLARRFYKTRKEAAKWLQELQLNPAAAKTLVMDVTSEGARADQEGLKDERNKAQIWEVWDKDSGQVLYVAPGSGENAILGQKPPPVKFRDFWPCPRPMLATTTSKNLIPTPDYALYQDQAEELNQISGRISVLQKALKVAGVYASESAELAQLIESGDNRMIPVKNWAMFAEGGAKNRIEWFPVEIVAEVLKSLYEMRDQAKQTLYEVSGIGDILRGASDPNETLGAQKIKTQWGSLRVRRIQKDVQRFAADIMRLKAEVIAEQFQFRTITQMAGLDEELVAKFVPMPPQPQMPPPQTPPQPQAQAGPPQPGAPPQDPQAQAVAQMQAQAQQQAQQQLMQQWQMQKMQAVQQFLAQVEKLLRDDTARSFRIDVETDSTLEPDQQEEKQSAVEFVTALTGFMEKAAPMAAASPEAAKMMGEILLWAIRRFGDQVDQLEQAIEQAVEAAAKPRPPPPNPDMIKAEADAKAKQADAMLKAKTADADMARKGQEMQMKMAGAQQAARLDAQIAQMQMAMEQRQSDAELQAMWAKLTMELQAIKAKGDAQIEVTRAKAAAAPKGDAD